MLRFWSSSPASATDSSKADGSSAAGDVSGNGATAGPTASSAGTGANGAVLTAGSPTGGNGHLDVDGASVAPSSAESDTAAPGKRERRRSFRAFGYVITREVAVEKTVVLNGSGNGEAAAAEKGEEAPKQKKVRKSRSEKKAEESAIALRTLIIGPDPPPAAVEAPAAPPAAKPKFLSKAEILKLKSLLLEPKSANKVIAKLRQLPIPKPSRTPKVGQVAPAEVTTAEASAPSDDSKPHGPIHAVCLDCTDEEADKVHFSRFSSTSFFGTPSIAASDASTVLPILTDMRVICLISAPDLGLSEGVSGQGVLSGGVPSPETVANGLTQLTQQLLALGFATSNIIHPNHKGVYPPLDRISVLTYWWGLEVCLPPASMSYLSKVHSIQSALLNLLSALALFNSGVREVLPFVRYISQFIDFEWTSVKAQDQGKGVVCAATWVMPAALVPRPWDFPPPPDTVTTKELSQQPIGTSFPFAFAPPVATPSLPQVMITPATLPRGGGGFRANVQKVVGLGVLST